MKKLFLLFTVLCAAVAVQAQVISAYTMQATQGTYTEITDGVAMDTTGLALEDAITGKAWIPAGVLSETTTGVGFPIGFDFEYNDIICNQFIIGSQGYIALGRDEITHDPTNGWGAPVINDVSTDNILGLFINAWNGYYCLETTEYSYKLEGEAPNRTLVVQYKDMGVCFGYGAEEVAKVNLQIRLHETSNTIEFVFGDFSYIDEETTKMARIGLRGYYDDILTLMDGEEEGMINYQAVAGDESATYGGTVPAGITYTFTPPAECEAPATHIDVTRITPQSSIFSMEWAPLEGADRALIVLAKESYLTQEPQSGVFYKEGDELGGGIVLAFTTDTIYEPWEDELVLEPSTEYYLHLYVANTYCARGPKYDEGVLSSFTTMPAGPASLTITNTTLNTLTFDVESNGTDDVLVLITDSVRLNPPYAAEIEFGTPVGSYNVGDVIDNKGRVVYVGPSAQGVVVDGLEDGTAYYLRAHSVSANYSYSSGVAEDRDATTALLPWAADFGGVDLNYLPAGWTGGGQEQFGKVILERYNLTDEEGNEILDEWGDPVQGEIYGLEARTSANSTDGALNTLSFGKFFVNQRDAAFTLSYNMYIWQRFGGNQPYEWAENDTLALQVRREGGEWTNDVLLLASNYVKAEATEWVPVELDLVNYENETIEIRLYSRVFANSQVYIRLDSIKAEGRPVPVVPVVTVSDITWNSALVTWRGEQENYEFAYAKAGEDFTTQVVAGKEVALTDLTHLTEYQVKVRGIVSDEEYSDWSEVATFTTADLPACPLPEGLTHVETEDYGDKLTWNLNEEHLSWDLRYRESTTTTWIDVEGLTTNEYVLYDLVPGAAYLWRVRAYCDMDRVSGYASQETFNANGKSAISAADADRLTVVAGNGVINVYNTDVYVESVTLLDMQGRVVANYAINGRENITIPTNATGVALVVVKTIDNQFVYKVKM